MSGFQRQATLADVSWDLTEAGKEKLAGLAESVEFESEESFKSKLNVLKESFVSTGNEQPQQSSGELLEESAEVLAPTAEEGLSSHDGCIHTSSLSYRYKLKFNLER